MGHIKIILILGCSLFSVTSNAVFCTHAEQNINRAADYISTVVDAIGYVKTGYQTLDTSLDKDTIAIFTAHKKSMENYECAISLIKPFINSKDKVTKTSAEAFVSSITNLTKHFEEVKNDLKNEMDGIKTNEGAGTKAERTAERNTQIRQNWETWLQSVVLASYSLMKIENSEKTKTTQLKITIKEKDTLVKKLKPLIEKKKSDTKYAYQIAAEALHKTLTGKWRFSPTPEK